LIMFLAAEFSFFPRMDVTHEIELRLHWFQALSRCLHLVQQVHGNVFQDIEDGIIRIELFNWHRTRFVVERTYNFSLFLINFLDAGSTETVTTAQNQRNSLLLIK
jgi:hypothetical protein